MSDRHLELIDAEIADVNKQVQDFESQIDVLRAQMQESQSTLGVLTHLRKKLDAAEQLPQTRNGKITSATTEIRRLLAIQPMSKSDLADAIGPHLSTESPTPRRMVTACADQLIRRGAIIVGHDGLARLADRH